jgi:hypothetical protein
MPRLIKKKRLTLSDLWACPEKMAAFMDWPFEADEVIEGWQKHKRKRTAIEATAERIANLLTYCRDKPKHRLHLHLVQEWARESLGISGRSLDEIRKKAIALRPDIYSADGNFKPIEPIGPVSLEPEVLV